jgi:DNA-binding beta-propeller fold protein YncE
MYKRRLVKIFVVLFVLVTLFCSMQSTIYAYDEQDYVLNAEGRKIPIPVTYNAILQKNYFGSEIGQLSRPSDIFIDKKDNIYITDAGQNRIILTDNKMSKYKQLNNFSGETLKNPGGIYVYDNGNMLIADTDNGRLLLVSPDGTLIKKYNKPVSTLYDNSYAFRPLKVYVNLIGQIYIINKDDYHGFIVIDEKNEFKGYVAPTKLPFDLRDKIISMFTTQAQKDKLGQKKPPMHTNFLIDDENSIYVTTLRAETAQLQRFSTVGKNIFPNQGFFGEKNADYVLKYYGKDFIVPEFTDLCVDPNGVVSILDSVSGRIYQYDNEGNILMVFGGTGTWKGKFIGATSLALDSAGNIFVIDSTQSTVTQFKPTNFTETVHTALKLYYNGNYDESVKYWKQVLDMNPTYPMAHAGMGDAYLHNEQYGIAMNEFKLAGNVQGYSDSFDQYLLLMIRKNFAFVFVGIIAFFVALVALLRFYKKCYKKSYSQKSKFKWLNEKARLRMILGTIFDPVEGLRTIRDHRQKFDIVVPLIILILVLVSKITSLFITHYPFAPYDLGDINLTREIIILYVPLLTWVIGNYLVTTIRSGEVRLIEVFSATAYSMIPYVLITIPLALFSNILSSNSVYIYSAINTVMWIWIVILFCVGVMTMNSYTVPETVKAVLLTLFACVFMWVVLALIFMLGQQVIDFVRGIYENYKIYFSLNGG